MTKTIEAPTSRKDSKIWSTGDLGALKKGDFVFVKGYLEWCFTQKPQKGEDDNGNANSKFKASVRITDKDMIKQLKTIKSESGVKLKTSNLKQDEETDEMFIDVNFNQNEFMGSSKAYDRNGGTVPIFDTAGHAFNLPEGEEIDHGSYGTVKGTPYVHKTGMSLNLTAIQLEEYLPRKAGEFDAGAGFETSGDGFGESFPSEAGGMDDVPFS